MRNVRSTLAREIADGLLDVLMQRLTRFEVHRLLARCASAVGDGDAAKTSMRAAAEEAASAGYLNLETLALRELSTLGTSRRSDTVWSNGHADRRYAPRS